MVINTNLSAQSSASLLMQSSELLSKSLARLSSGSKITSPADDSAGLAVSMKLNAQMARIDGATNNVGNAISFNQTQDGYLQKVADALDRMSELAILAQDVTKSSSDRSLYNQEFQTLSKYIKDVATKDFNGVSLFGGTVLNVTVDSDANTFAMTGVDLASTTYTNAVGTSATTSGDTIDTTEDASQSLTDVKAAPSRKTPPCPTGR
jgi:flagellin